MGDESFWLRRSTAQTSKFACKKLGRPTCLSCEASLSKFAFHFRVHILGKILITGMTTMLYSVLLRLCQASRPFIYQVAGKE